MKSIAIMHYAGPPTVGGVESTMYYHALGLRALGYTVRVVSGRGDSFYDDVQTLINPLFGSTHPDVLAIKQALDRGEVTPAFYRLVERIEAGLAQALADCDVCMVHNVLTLNKNLPLAAALHRFVQLHHVRMLAWCHDLAWTNPQYQPELHEGYPWDLLRTRWDGVTYVTVSEPRRYELADLLGMSSDEVNVVVPGVDPAAFYHWTPTTQMLEPKLRLLDADGILLLPARITRRKNHALGLRVLAALRQQSGRDFRLVITGPPGPHNPTNPGYLGELLELRESLKLEDSVHFLYAYGDPLILDYATLADFYHIADALFFPSFQEGFGIPILEAGFAGLPVFCSDIPPFHTTGQDAVHYFDPIHDEPDTIAATILHTLDVLPSFRLRVHVRQRYRWERIIEDTIQPLIEKG